MSSLRNRIFLEGIVIGGVFGIIIGSAIAFTIGASSKEAIRRLLDERFPTKRRTPFQYLSQ